MMTATTIQPKGNASLTAGVRIAVRLQLEMIRAVSHETVVIFTPAMATVRLAFEEFLSASGLVGLLELYEKVQHRR